MRAERESRNLGHGVRGLGTIGKVSRPVLEEHSFLVYSSTDSHHQRMTSPSYASESAALLAGRERHGTFS